MARERRVVGWGLVCIGRKLAWTNSHLCALAFLMCTQSKSAPAPDKLEASRSPNAEGDAVSEKRSKKRASELKAKGGEEQY